VTLAALWIGLVEIAAGPGNLDVIETAGGAFSNAICLCSDEGDFMVRVTQHLLETRPRGRGLRGHRAVR
jgi:hypothetical protein